MMKKRILFGILVTALVMVGYGSIDYLNKSPIVIKAEQAEVTVEKIAFWQNGEERNIDPKSREYIDTEKELVSTLEELNLQAEGVFSEERMQKIKRNNRAVEIVFKKADDFQALKNVKTAIFVLEDNLNEGLEGRVLVGHEIEGNLSYSCWAIQRYNEFLDKSWIEEVGKSLRVPTTTPLPAQGTSPFAIATTQDGKYAYISFDLSDVVFKIDLQNFTVASYADLSAYFPIESELIALDQTEQKLFVYTSPHKKLLVLDAQTLELVDTIENVRALGMTRSRYGPFLIVSDGTSSAKIINTETYEVTEREEPSSGFLRIEESEISENIWYSVAQRPGLQKGTLIVGVYDHSAGKWDKEIPFSLQDAEHEGIFDLEVLPNEQKAYVVTLGAFTPEGEKGWLYSIDLLGGSVSEAILVDGGALCLEKSPDGKLLYVGAGWPPKVPYPAVRANILVVNTQSDKIVGRLNLGRTRYGWTYTQVNDLQIDPSNPRFLYATAADANAFVKIDLNESSLSDEIIFNHESLQPYFVLKQPFQNIGYVLMHDSNYIFRIRLGNGTVEGPMHLYEVPRNYGASFDSEGRLFLAAREGQILEVDPQDMRLVETHNIQPRSTPLESIVHSRDGKKIYSISEDPNTGLDTLFIINAEDYKLETQINLENKFFWKIPYELPDGSKIYAVRTEEYAPISIHVIETRNYTIQKTIVFEDPELQGITTGQNPSFAYDTRSHTLFVGGFYAVLVIDTDKDVIKQVIPLQEGVARALGIEPWDLTCINAVGLVYHPEENYLYIFHLDRSFVSIYDINANHFLPQIIPLRGWVPSSITVNEDYTKIYVGNKRSDSLSVIDVGSKKLDKVIDLHEYYYRVTPTEEEPLTVTPAPFPTPVIAVGVTAVAAIILGVFWLLKRKKVKD